MPKRPAMDDEHFLIICALGNTQDVIEAIQNGANINAKDKYGRTALILAVEGGHTGTAELLLKLGADVNAKDF